MYAAGSHAWPCFLTPSWAHPTPRVSSRDDRKILPLSFGEFPALHETPSPWKRSEHAGFEHGDVNKGLASCRLCNWGETLSLLLPSPIYLACRQFGPERHNFSPFPHVVLCYGRALMRDIKCKDTVPGSGHLGCKLLGAGESSGEVLSDPCSLLSPRHPLSVPLWDRTLD